MRRHGEWALSGASVEQSRAVRDGVGLGFLEAGDGHLPPLLFVHGWACDHRFFVPQLAHFAPRHRVVVVDQRGFGTSDKPPPPYSVDGSADDLAWLCAELGITEAVVVGHSMGGAVALSLSARHPGLCAGLALCDPAVFLPPWATESRAEFIRGLSSPAYRDVLKLFATRHLFSDGDDPAQRRWILEAMCETPQHVLRATLQAIYDFDAEAAARGCRVPMLCVESAAPLVGTRRLRELCPQVEVASVPEVGHFHQLLAPHEINALLEAFVTERVPPATKRR
ncbi:MAG: alpha/beta hydrolase [Myxococcota bacterium]|nr:alpha/beta hydrolase [Myxococcota bacterium]